MRYSINYSLLKNKQRGGSYPLYVEYTRMDVSQLKALVLINLIQESINLNRYFHSYYDHTNILQKSGIHSAFGPDGFNMDNIDVKHLGIDQYESTLIYDELVEINRLIAPIGLKTIQSGVSYWDSDIEFVKPYFQLPWIEFVGRKEAIPILKMIINHPLANNYMSFTFSEFNERVRTCILRPYIDDDGNQIHGINDSEFWSNIIKILKDLNNVPTFDISKNDPELDYDKDWYILDPNREIVLVTNKDSLNPYNTDIPLSKLDVRYEKDYHSFMKKI